MIKPGRDNFALLSPIHAKHGLMTMYATFFCEVMKMCCTYSPEAIHNCVDILPLQCPSLVKMCFCMSASAIIQNVSSLEKEACRVVHLLACRVSLFRW